MNSYPLWKNTLLIIVAMIGLIYAIPNLYSEYPEVQISPQKTDQIADFQSLRQQVEKLLTQKQIAYRKVLVTQNHLAVRFNSTDNQLIASDYLKNQLGNQYTIALNLAPSTPQWLATIGANPMKQGLDLRGGVHFLLEVDIESVVHRRYEGMLRNVAQQLREKNIRYAGIYYAKNQGIKVRFRDHETANQATSIIQSQFPDLLVTHQKDSQQFLIALLPEELNQIRQNTIEQTMSILRNRVNELGVAEAVVQQQGLTRIAVDLPGIQDATRAKQILGGTATLQFHLVDGTHDPFIAQKTGAIPLNDKLYIKDRIPLLLKRQVVLSGDSITSAISSYDQQSASPTVDIQLGGGGESYFTQITQKNVGQRMAIVFVETKTFLNKVDDKLERITRHEERIISAPVIQSALGSRFQITGLSSHAEASNLALLLRAGALPAAIYPIEERTVGPSMGKENIHRGLISLEMGMGLILLVMLIYYRFFGLVANIALLLNLILLCAILSMIGATLTLPGIAGIVLTVGMAVDANVLIYERIREELRHGVSIQSSIHAGYERAFSTILDANITTFIVAIVLFSIGTGPVKGFAVTLSIGLLTSMLTGVTYTRAIVNWIYGGRQVKKLSIGI